MKELLCNYRLGEDFFPVDKKSLDTPKGSESNASFPE